MTADSTVANFWQAPPWQGGRTPFRLGLRPVGEGEWLPDPICIREYQRKSIYLSAHRDAVLAEVPAYSGTVRAVAEVIAERLAARAYPDPGTDESHPLARAALMVPDDLCVLVPGAGGWMLAGACLCSPSYWRLADKIGRTLTAIHGPVAGLEQALGSRIARFLDRLPPGQVFERRNWNLHRGAERFHPEPERWDPPPDPAGCEMLYVRSERQTLRRLGADALLFTIGVGVHRLGDIRDHPAAIADLLQAIEAMSPEERDSFGYRHHGDALVTWLRGLQGT